MKKIYILLGTIFMGGSIMAQAPYMYPSYEFNSGDKYAPGSITTVDSRVHNTNQDRTVYYSEDFDAGFGGWVDAIQTGTAPFKLTNTGHDNTTGNTFIIPVLATDTPTQWVLLDSDKDGTGYGNPEAATLTSPVIDLSSTSGNYVAFQFDQFFAEWQPTTGETEDHCFIGVSTDGVSWTEIEINEGVGRDARPNPELISWDISDFISGSLSTVQLRFRWEGAWNYGWQIDNVEIIDINANDIQMVDTYRTYSPNGLVYSRVPSAHATEMVIGGIIKNIGHFDATNVNFDWQILDPSLSVVASGTTTDNLTLSNAEQDTILVATGFTPSALGNYTVEWTATSNEGDNNPTDNTVSDAFYELTDYEYAMDYDLGSIEEIDNWPLLTADAYFGNLFDFAGPDVVSGVEIQLTNHPEIENEEIFIQIDYHDGTDWGPLYAQSDTYIIQSSDIGQTVFIPIEGGVNVDQNYLYLFMVGQYSSAAQPIFQRQGDIKFSYIQGRDTDGAYRGFFDRKAPMLRLRVVDDVNVSEETMNESFSVYPNPATDAININLVLNNSENTVVNVVDISGKVITTMNLGDITGEKKVSIPVDNLTTGVYFIELVNADGKQVKKFVKK